MLTAKLSTSLRIPVILIDDTSGLPLNGEVFGDVTATICKGDGTTASISVTALNWVEITAGSFSAAGRYVLTVPGASLGVLGLTSVSVKTADSNPYVFDFFVQNNTSDEIYTGVAGVQATVDDTATNAEVAALNSNVGVLDSRVQMMQLTVDDLYQFSAGRWKIHTSGADANRIVYYHEDGTTVLAKFDLKDLDGDPTFRSAFERTPA